MAWTPDCIEDFKTLYMNGDSNAEIADIFSATEDQVKHFIATNRESLNLPYRKDIVKSLNTDNGNEQISEGSEFSTDGKTATIKMTINKEIKTLEELIEVCKIDTEKYKIESFTCKSWMGYIKNARSQVEKTQLFAVSAKLVVKKNEIMLSDTIDKIIERLSQKAPEFQVSEKVESDLMLELSIPDIHFGKLAWKDESGENYDVNITKNLYAKSVLVLLDRTEGYTFDTINLVVGNDFFNADNFENTTTRGTAQTTDGRQPKTFMIAVDVITNLIDQHLYKRCNRVVVTVVPGNHDSETSFYLGEVLKAYYKNMALVEIDNEPTSRKYIKYGEVLIMYTHGNEEKHTELPLIMATEKPVEWGSTKFREIHLGHFHARKATTFVGVNENKGVVTRILPSLCATDDWHYKKGYIGNIRSAEAYVWSKNEGLITTVTYTPKFVDGNVQ